MILFVWKGWSNTYLSVHICAWYVCIFRCLPKASWKEDCLETSNSSYLRKVGSRSSETRTDILSIFHKCKICESHKCITHSEYKYSNFKYNGNNVRKLGGRENKGREDSKNQSWHYTHCAGCEMLAWSVPTLDENSDIPSTQQSQPLDTCSPEDLAKHNLLM